VLIVGDGRMDSPGFCAKYCTYTAMDYTTKEIIDIVITDKGKTGLKSCNMELAAFRKTMSNLSVINVKEVVTDAHLQINAEMS